MESGTELNHQENRHTTLCVIAVAAGLLIYVALRARWIGHLLTWDEAMNLCAVRALATLSRDHFSNWIWRHPPLFPVMTLLLQPLKQGFAERVQILALAVGVVNLALLYALNRKVFGRAAAVLSVFFLAVLPGSMFFDVWVKRDHPVITFGLTAILLLVSRRPLWAGLCLGFAMLTKESAVFYALAVGLLWLCGAAGKRNVKDFLALIVTPVLACVWWYHLSMMTAEPLTEDAAWLDRIFGSATEHVRLALDADSGWGRPWNHYLLLLPHVVGAAGLAIAGIGAVAILVRIVGTMSCRDREIPNVNAQCPSPDASFLDVRCWTLDVGRSDSTSSALLWPLAVLVPSYLLLSLLKSKVPWVPMAMLPAWATLQGVALAWLLTYPSHVPPGGRTCGEPTTRYSLALPIKVLTTAFILTASLHYACKQDYDDMLHHIAPGQRRGARWSHDAAVAMNMAVRDTDRVLITSFHYWHGIVPGQACAVFAYYYTRPTAVLIKPHETTFTDLVADIRKHKIDWALLSPMLGEKEHEIFGGFVEELKLKPIKFERAWLFRTTEVWEGRKIKVKD